jgi:hypothetical protein
MRNFIFFDADSGQPTAAARADTTASRAAQPFLC